MKCTPTLMNLHMHAVQKMLNATQYTRKNTPTFLLLQLRPNQKENAVHTNHSVKSRPYTYYFCCLTLHQSSSSQGTSNSHETSLMREMLCPFYHKIVTWSLRRWMGEVCCACLLSRVNFSVNNCIKNRRESFCYIYFMCIFSLSTVYVTLKYIYFGFE